jgi:membrane-associated phospholipid phosphatase
MKQIGTTKLSRLIALRFAQGDALGVHLTIGVLAMAIAIAIAIFSGIAVPVMNGSAALASFDHDIAQSLQQHAMPALTLLMLAVTHAHGVIGIGVLGALLCAWFWRKKAYYWLLTAMLVIPGGMLLNVVLKHVFMRTRPASQEALLTLATYSFPSGHTASATLFYGVIAAYLVCAARAMWVRSAIVAAALSMVALVGASRIYLGVHYFSDVLAASVEGCGWLAICITFMRIIEIRISGNARALRR